MEDINIKELDIDYYKKELQSAIRELHDAQEEIKALGSEIEDQNILIRSLREEIDKISHENEVVITTKHPIENIEIYFKK